jgi:hypothetical protein
MFPEITTDTQPSIRLCTKEENGRAITQLIQSTLMQVQDLCEHQTVKKIYEMVKNFTFYKFNLCKNIEENTEFLRNFMNNLDNQHKEILHDDRILVDITYNIANIIDTKTGTIYTMNKFGTNILENLIKGVSVNAIKTELQKFNNFNPDTNEQFENYLDHIGLFFIFTACAGISIIVWVFNWICWLNNCCCCDFLHNPVNKRIAWWMSFSFLLGILACCVSAFVSANRFGFALEGAWCAVDRVYYDSLYGQLKASEPLWEGMENVTTISNDLSKFYEFITRGSFNWTDFIGNCSTTDTGTTTGKDTKKWCFNSTNGNYWKPPGETADEKQEKQYHLQITRFNIIINSLARLIKFKPDPTDGISNLTEILNINNF